MLNLSKIITALANNALELFSGLAVVVFITRLYSPEEAGAWFLFTNIVFLISKVREGFTQISLVKDAAIDNWGGVKACWLANTGIEILCGTICYGVAGYIEGPMGELLYAYPLFAIAWAWYRWGIFVLQSRLMPQRQLWVQISYLVMIAGVLVSVWFFPVGIGTLAIYLGIATGLSGLISWVCFSAWRIWGLSTSKKDWQQMAHYGLHGVVREFAGTLSARSYIFFTASFLSLAETAILGVAQRYVQLILMPNAAIQSLCFAYTCRLYKEGQSRLRVATVLSSATIGLWGLFVVVLLSEALYGESLLVLLHGEEYASAWLLMLLLSFITALFSPIGNAFGSLVNVLGVPALGSRLVLQNSIINIVLTAVSTYYIGLYGVVIAPLITELLGSLFILQLVEKRLKLRPDTVLKQGLYHLLSLWPYASRKINFTQKNSLI